MQTEIYCQYLCYWDMSICFFHCQNIPKYLTFQYEESYKDNMALEHTYHMKGVEYH